MTFANAISDYRREKRASVIIRSNAMAMAVPRHPDFTIACFVGESRKDGNEVMLMVSAHPSKKLQRQSLRQRVLLSHIFWLMKNKKTRQSMWTTNTIRK